MSETTQTNPEIKQEKGIPPVVQMILGLVIATFIAWKYPGVARNAIAFVIILGILVFVHEWGHFQFARWAGMKVNRFALGFPPFVYNREKDGIVYSIGALPIGGMVDIAGLGSEEEMVNTAKGEADTPKRDTTRPFGQKQFQDGSLFWRFMVIFAGPLMNFIFAIILAVGLYSFWGAPDPTTAKYNLVANFDKESPADKGGVKVGDLIVGVDGTRTNDNQKITSLIRNGKSETLTLDVLREGQVKTLTIRPEVADPDKTGNVRRVVGVEFSYDPKTLKFIKISPQEAVTTAFAESWMMVRTIGAFVGRAFTFQLTDQDKKGVGGPLAIAQAAGQSTQQGGLWGPLRLMVILSINLGLLNLLPLPALDGGRILFLLYELIMRRPIPAKIEGITHAAGMVLLLTFMVFITMRDVVRMVGGGERWQNNNKTTTATPTPATTPTAATTPTP
jgi:regulator of sigma E protease